MLDTNVTSMSCMLKTKQCKNWKGREKGKQHFKFYSERKSGVNMPVCQKPRL